MMDRQAPDILAHETLHLTWLVLPRPEQRTPAEHHRLAPLTAQEAKSADAITLAQDVAQLVSQRQARHLASWLVRVAEGTLVPLQRLAKGRCDDDDTVIAGVVTLP